MPDRIAIVGAGLSGLLAARDLSAAGKVVRVFEKARGTGGRLATRRSETTAFDHGAQYFTVRGSRFQREVDAWLAQGLVARWDPRLVDAADGKIEPHPSTHARYMGVPRMSAITRSLAEGHDLHLGRRVMSMTAADGGWRLHDETSDLGRYSAVLVTTPPEQAVPLLADSPDLASLAASVRSEPCWAVMMAFDSPLHAPFEGAFVQDERLAWAAHNSSKPGRPQQETWVLHGTTSWSREHAEAPAETVSAALVEAFFEATGLEPQTPVFTSAHRWLLARAEGPLESGALWDAKRKLGVCGDWCSGGEVEGAVYSGLEAAQRLLA